MRRLKLVVVILAALGAAIVLAGCGGGNEQLAKQRKESVSARAETFARAEAISPLPKTENFPLRKALVKFTERQDLLDHPWYVYIYADTGNIIGYYVAQTVPINACNFLSSTEEVRTDTDGGNLILTAPSLDGIFYGGGGTSAGCDSWFFFDVATDTLVQIRAFKWVALDQPLRVDAKPLEIKVTK